MARRLRRSGPASRPMMLAVLAAAVLVAALVLTGRVLDRHGGERRPPAGVSSAHGAAATTQAPYRAGGTVGCPSLWPVLAMSNHASYPAGHPARPPPDARSVACFQTTVAAASAGCGPARAGAAVHPGCVRGPARLRRRPGWVQRPLGRRDADPWCGRWARLPVPGRAPDRHAGRAADPG